MDERPAGGAGAVDIKVKIPELTDINSFWIRGYAAHYTFGDLYRECINHPEVLRSQKSLTRVPASRHFWCGDRLMLRGEPIATALTRTGRPSGGEISLVLRSDYYRVLPPRYLVPGVEYTYLDAEAPIGKLVSQILSKEENLCSFDLYNRKRRLTHDKSLAHYELWPAWQDAPADEFPARAELRLRPRTSWLPYALLAVAVLLGTTTGYTLMRALLHG